MMAKFNSENNPKSDNDSYSNNEYSIFLPASLTILIFYSMIVNVIKGFWPDCQWIKYSSKTFEFCMDIFNL